VAKTVGCATESLLLAEWPAIAGNLTH
jgi:hypothetical protein